jgi:hypothetical protein
VAVFFRTTSEIYISASVFATAALSAFQAGATPADTLQVTGSTGSIATSNLAPWADWSLTRWKNFTANKPAVDGFFLMTDDIGNIASVQTDTGALLSIAGGCPTGRNRTYIQLTTGFSTLYIDTSGGASSSINLGTPTVTQKISFYTRCDGTVVTAPYFITDLSELSPQQRTSVFADPSTVGAPPAPGSTTVPVPLVISTSFEFDISTKVPDIEVLVDGVPVPYQKRSSNSASLLAQYFGVVTVQYRKPQARVYINKKIQPETSYSVVGDTVVFVTPPPVGSLVDIGIDYLSERVTFEIQGDSLRDLKKLSYIYMDMALPEEQGQAGGLDLEYWIDGDRQRGIFIPDVYRHPELTWGTAIWNGSYPTTREDTRAKIPARGLFHYMKLRFRNKGPGSFSINGWELKVKQLGQKAK